MPDTTRPLLLTLLAAMGCPGPGGDDTGKTVDDTGETGETGNTAVSERGCYTVPVGTSECPDPATVPTADVLPQTCGAEVLSVDGPGTAEECAWIGGATAGGWCVYPITVIPPDTPCDYGRPLTLGGAPRLAPLVRGEGWSAGATGEVRPDLTRARAWAQVGRAEHASVASFARFALELMAVGAPAELVSLAHAAAMDEVRHAQLAFGLVRRFGGASVEPGPLPLADLRVEADLPTIAAAATREGCIAETLSALQTAAARDRADDAAEHAVLGVVTRDEERHAALAWRFVRWAIQHGGEPVRAAVSAALSEAPALPEGEGGLLPLPVARELVARGWRDVVRPAADALLAADAGGAGSTIGAHPASA